MFVRYLSVSDAIFSSLVDVMLGRASCLLLPQNDFSGFRENRVTIVHCQLDANNNV